MMNKLQILAVVSTLFLCTMTRAQEPVININKKYHPNLAEAQQHIVAANRAIALAQKDNQYDMQGHAEKARQLLAEADKELRAAADAANAHAKKGDRDHDKDDKK